MKSLQEFLMESINEGYIPSPWAKAVMDGCLNFTADVFKSIDGSIDYEHNGKKITIKWGDVSHLYQEFISKAVADLTTGNMDKGDIKAFCNAVANKDPEKKFKFNSNNGHLSFADSYKLSEFAEPLDEDIRKIIKDLQIPANVDWNDDTPLSERDWTWNIWAGILYKFVNDTWEKKAKEPVTMEDYGTLTFLPKSGFSTSISCSFFFTFDFKPKD